MEDFSFRSDMDEFIYARLQPITLTRKVLKKDAAKVLLTDHEKSQLRGLIASLNWLSREGRPDVAAAASILASAFPEPTAFHVNAANDTVRQCQDSPNQVGDPRHCREGLALCPGCRQCL